MYINFMVIKYRKLRAASVLQGEPANTDSNAEMEAVEGSGNFADVISCVSSGFVCQGLWGICSASLSSVGFSD